VITIREYALLTTERVEPSLDLAQVTPSAFDWLCELSAGFSKRGARLLQVEGRRWLRWDSYVGIVETPCGVRIEIVPKHIEQGDCLLGSRQLLRKLIQTALHLTPRQTSLTSLELFDAPLSEWVMGQFLDQLDYLLKRGIRFDYQRIEEEQRFLRGQLDMVKQMRQPPGRQHYFQLRHDVYLPDRAENRLLKLALLQVASTTQDARNWRLANELRGLFEEVPASKHVKSDLLAWGKDRLMAHYRDVKPWCELILNQQMPIAVAGQWQGLSMLFPMEKLFEHFVGDWLQRQLSTQATLSCQADGKYLCAHGQGQMFGLRPDFLIDSCSRRWVLDTKWKRLRSDAHGDNYQLQQSDFYQLFAYGHKYRDGQAPRLVLIYPYWSGLQKALPVFDYGADLHLWVLPFDLENEYLLGSNLAGLPLRTQADSCSDYPLTTH